MIEASLRRRLFFRSIIGKLTPFPSHRAEIIIEYLDKDQNEVVLGEDLEELLRLSGKSKEKKIQIASYCVQSKKITTTKSLKIILPFVTNEQTRYEITQSWLENAERTTEDLKEILPLFDNDSEAYSIAETWFEEKSRTREDLKEILPLFTDEYYKSSTAESWLEKEARTREDLKEILPFISDSRKTDLILIFLKQNNNEESKYQDLLDLAKSGLVGSMYDLEKITETYHEVNLPIAKFPDFCKTLYPLSENLQTELFCEGITVFSQPSLLENKSSLLNFIESINDDEYALESLKTLKEKLALTSLEILKTSSIRLNRNYESISELLGVKTVADSLTPEGLLEIKNYFPDQEGISTLPADTNLASLLSFYQMEGGEESANTIAIFKSLLKPEIVEEMRQKFILSDRKVLVFDQDFEAMENLLNQEDSDLGFLPVSILSDHLKDCANFSNLTTEEIESYQIGNSAILSKEKKQQKPVTS